MFSSLVFLTLILSAINCQHNMDVPSSLGGSSDHNNGPAYNLDSILSDPVEGNAAARSESAPVDEGKDQSVEINAAAGDSAANVDLGRNSGPITSDAADKSMSSQGAGEQVQENSDVSDQPMEGKSKSQEVEVENNPVSSDDSLEPKSKGCSQESPSKKVQTTPPPKSCECQKSSSKSCECEMPRPCELGVPTCVTAPMYNPMDKFGSLVQGMITPISAAAKSGMALPSILVGKLSTGASTMKNQMMSAASSNPMNHYGGVMGSKMASSGETLLKSMSGKLGLLNAYFNSLTTQASIQCVPMVCRPVLCAPPTTTTTTTKAPVTTPRPCQIYSYARCC